MEQATATDAQGKRRPFRTVAHAQARRNPNPKPNPSPNPNPNPNQARRKALERRRDTLRSARGAAEAALRRLVDDYAAG